MKSKRPKSSDASENRVPIENAGFAMRAKISPERLEKLPMRIERHAADNVSERRAVKYSQEETREREDSVPEGLPHGDGYVAAKFERDTAQDEEPQNDHQGKIKPAEAGGVQSRERKIKRAARGEQPDFVGVPHRPDCAGDEPALGFAARDERVDDSRAEIESVEDDVDRQHQGC